MTNRNAAITLTLSGAPATGKDLLFAQFLPVLERFGLCVAPVNAEHPLVDAHMWNIWHPTSTVAYAIINTGAGWQADPVPVPPMPGPGETGYIEPPKPVCDPDGLPHFSVVKTQAALRKIVDTAFANGVRTGTDAAHKDFGALCKSEGLNPAETKLNDLISKVRADARTSGIENADELLAKAFEEMAEELVKVRAAYAVLEAEVKERRAEGDNFHKQRASAAAKWGPSAWASWGMILEHVSGRAGKTGQDDGHAEGYAKRSAEVADLMRAAGLDPVETSLEEYGRNRHETGYAAGYASGCRDTENEQALERNHTRKDPPDTIVGPGLAIKHVGPLNLTVIYGGKSGEPNT